MRILKSHPLLKLANSYVIDSPQPSNLSYMWNFGSLLAFCLIIQIVTGVTLAMHYNPSVQEAFNSVEHIMRDVNNGWLIRYLHSNTASAFFFLVYLHIGRGLYYGSYKAPRTLTWTIGTIILVLMMATAFLGYLHSPTWFNNDFGLDILFFSPLLLVRKMSTRSDNTGDNGPENNNYKDNNSSSNNSLEILIKNAKLKPIAIYDKLDQPSVRKAINSELKGLAGIYMIYNKVSNHYYIGSASTGRFYSRFYKHLISLDGSKIVKNAVKRYKLNNFIFVVLELFPEEVTVTNNKNLIDLEDFYLKSLLPDYNILTEAGSSFGYKHTEMIRIKMKENYSQERKKFIGDLNRGKHLSKKTIELLSKSAIGRKLEYTAQGMLNMKKSAKPIIVYNLNGTIYGEFSNLKEAAQGMNCNEKTIRRALKSDSKKLKKHHIVKYVSDIKDKKNNNTTLNKYGILGLLYLKKNIIFLFCTNDWCSI